MKKNTSVSKQNQVKDSADLADRMQLTAIDQFTLYKKQSDSLESVGIYEDDLLVIQLTNQNDENQVSVWKDKDNDFLVGFAYDNFGDISINYLLGIERQPKKDMRLLGLVVGKIQHFDAQKPQQNKAREIKAICDGCEKEINGTPEFIKSEGWELEENKAVCLNCDLFGRRAK